MPALARMPLLIAILAFGAGCAQQAPENRPVIGGVAVLPSPTTDANTVEDAVAQATPIPDVNRSDAGERKPLQSLNNGGNIDEPGVKVKPVGTITKFAFAKVRLFDSADSSKGVDLPVASLPLPVSVLEISSNYRLLIATSSGQKWVNQSDVACCIDIHQGPATWRTKKGKDAFGTRGIDSP